MVRPDYAGGGFVNLIASIAAACGGTPRHPPLRDLPPGALAGARNLVLLIVDGLGDAYLRREGCGGALLGHRRGALTSVFPSTTASAITTSLTGWSPLEHGMTGWFTLFGEAGCVGAALPYLRRGERSTLGVTPAHLFRAPALVDGLARRSIVVTHRGATYNLHHCGQAERRAYDTLAELVEQTVAAATSGSEAKFIYVYWPEFDGHSHRHGNASPEVRAHFSEVDEAFAALSSTARARTPWTSRMHPASPRSCAILCAASRAPSSATCRKDAAASSSRVPGTGWASGRASARAPSWSPKAGSAPAMRIRASPSGSGTSRCSCTDGPPSRTGRPASRGTG